MTSKDDILSKLMLTLTEYDPDINVMELRWLYAKMKMTILNWGGDSIKRNLILTGSSAELRIRTMHLCIDDIDMMCTLGKYMIAVTDDDRPKERLNIPLDSMLTIVTMVPQPEYPCYVELRIIDRMQWAEDIGKYMTIEGELVENSYLANQREANTYKIKGPAVRIEGSDQDDICLYTDYDFVDSIRCSYWPADARNFFINRPRCSQWPSKQLLSEAVDLGCDVVTVAHPKCRPLDTLQWRISFSKAEVILIRSWNLVRQLLYHMFRYFVKRTLQIGSEDKCIVSGYHLKTIMLWTCEEQEETFWNEGQLFKCLTFLISRLIHCVSERILNHYFVPQCNLFSSSERFDKNHIDEVVVLLKPFTEIEKLTDWFIDEYLLRPNEEKYMKEVFDTTTWTEFLHMVKTNSDWLSSAAGLSYFAKNINRAERFVLHRNRFAEMYCMEFVKKFCMGQLLDKPIIVHLCDSYQDYLKDFSRVGRKAVEFFKVFGFLSLAEKLQKLGRSCIDHEFIDIAMTLLLHGSHVNYQSVCSNMYFDDSPDSYFSKAISILVACKQISIIGGKEILRELSKWCLVAASKSPELTNVASVYLATLCLEEKEEMLAFRLCSAAALNESLMPERYRLQVTALPDCFSFFVALGFATLHDHVVNGIRLRHNSESRQFSFSSRSSAFYMLLSLILERHGSLVYSGHIDRWKGAYDEFLMSSLENVQTADLCLHALLVSQLRLAKKRLIRFQTYLSNNESRSTKLNTLSEETKLLVYKGQETEDRQCHTDPSVYESWSLLRPFQLLHKCSDDVHKDCNSKELCSSAFESYSEALQRVEAHFLRDRAKEIACKGQKLLVYDGQHCEDEKQYRSYLTPLHDWLKEATLVELLLYISANFDTLEVYKALHFYRIGDFVSSLNICNKIIDRESGIGLCNRFVPCSAPFNSLFDADLKRILEDNSGPVNLMIILFYLKIRCLLQLKGSWLDIEPSLLELGVFSEKHVCVAPKNLTSFLIHEVITGLKGLEEIVNAPSLDDLRISDDS